MMGAAWKELMWSIWMKQHDMFLFWVGGASCKANWINAGAVDMYSTYIAIKLTMHFYGIKLLFWSFVKGEEFYTEEAAGKNIIRLAITTYIYIYFAILFCNLIMRLSLRNIDVILSSPSSVWLLCHEWKRSTPIYTSCVLFIIPASWINFY